MACGLILAVTLAWVYATERVTLLSALVAALAAIGLLATWPQLRARPALASATLLNLSLVLLYFWSLGEAHHVTIQVSRERAVARVDGETIVLNQRLPGGNFGFRSEPYGSYRIQATGEALQADTQSWVGRLGLAIRTAEPGPAWTDIRLRMADGREIGPGAPIHQVPAGTWSTNRRGEWQGPSGSFTLFSTLPSPPYTLSADLVRPDGAQDLLLGVDRAGNGVALQVRLDQPDASWLVVRNGVTANTLVASSLQHLDLLADLQRAVRIVLTGYLFALLFLALTVGLYPIHLFLSRRRENAADDEWAGFTRLVRSRAFPWGFFALVSAIGLVFTGMVATFLLDRIPHVQDSVAYLYQAKIFALGRLNVPAPPLPIQSFFSEEYVPMFQGRWFTQYPPGHPLVLLIGVLLGGAWLIEPLLASLALGGIYLLGRRVYGNGAGMLAAALGLASPFWLFLGSSFMSHATGLFFIVAFMLCFARMEDDPRLVWPLLAGFVAGIAFITRQLTAAAALAPFALYAWSIRQIPLRSYLAAIGGFAVPAAFLLLYNAVQMGNPLQSTYAAWSPHYQLGFGPDAAPSGDFTPGNGLWNAYQNLQMLAVHLYGWPYAVAFAFMFLPFILGTARRWDYLLLASFLCVVVCYVFYWCPCLMYGPRFYYEALGPMLLLTSRGIFELGRLPLRVWPRLPRDPTWSGSFPAILLVALIAYNAVFYMQAQLPLYDNYNYSSDAELRTVAAAHIHHAIVFVEPQLAWFWSGYGNVFFANDPLLRGDIIYARDQGAQDSLLYRYFPGRGHYRLKESSFQGGRWTLTRIT